MSQLTLRSVDIPAIQRIGIGFDSIIEEMLKLTSQQGSANYPPYNIVKYNEDSFVIELAVAGFKEGDITVGIEKNILTVKGEQVVDLNEETEPTYYVYRGISARNFIRNFTLADHVEVLGASMENGILRIELERRIPEEQKLRKIEISYKK